MIIVDDWITKPYGPDNSKNSKISNKGRTRDTIKVVMLKEEMFLIQSLLQHLNYPNDYEMTMDTYSFRVKGVRQSLLRGIEKALKMRLEAKEKDNGNV